MKLGMQNSYNSGELAPQHPLRLPVEKLETGPRGTFLTGFGFLDWLGFVQTSDLLGKLDLVNSAVLSGVAFCVMHISSDTWVCVFISDAAGKKLRIAKIH